MTEIIEHPASLPPDDGDDKIHRHRIRVRKRIKIKKKKDPKKRIKKIIRLFVWLLVVVTFITTLIILFKEADVKDTTSNKKRSMLLTVNKLNNFC